MTTLTISPASRQQAGDASQFSVAENDCVVVSNQQINREYKLLVAEAPPTALTAGPGQFFHLSCPSVGQESPFLRRPMSVYSVDRTRGYISFLYKVQGAGTRGLAGLSSGDHLDALGPLGQGFNLPQEAKHVLLLARGVGLATLAPLALSAVGLGAKVTALFSVRSADLVMSVDYMTSAGVNTIVVTDEAGTSGVDEIERELRVRHLKQKFDFLATCGSNRFLDMLQRLGQEWQVPGEIALEQQMGCGLGMCFACVRSFHAKNGSTSYRRVCWEGPVFSVSEAMPWSI